MPETALVRKLKTFAELTADDEERLGGLLNEIRSVQARRDIISEGDRPEHVHLIVRGWAARYKMVPNGGRQILSFLIPGDFCDIHVTILGQMDHGIVALTPCDVAYVSSAALDKITRENNKLARALWWATLVDEGVLREWIVNVGRRDAYQRVAHLLCELHAKMKMIGLVEDDRLELPLTQEEIADAAGLTPVHTNRTLQRLRGEGLIELSGRVLTVHKVSALRKVGGFNPSYLHIERRLQ